MTKIQPWDSRTPLTSADENETYEDEEEGTLNVVRVKDKKAVRSHCPSRETDWNREWDATEGFGRVGAGVPSCDADADFPDNVANAADPCAGASEDYPRKQAVLLFAPRRLYYKSTPFPRILSQTFSGLHRLMRALDQEN